MYETEEATEEVDSQSRFAIALTRLLDLRSGPSGDSKFLSRNQWARVLGISPSAISQWLTDKTVPRPEVLRSILSIVKSRTKTSRNVLEEFEQIASLPAKDVSPLGNRMAKTVIHYTVGDTIGHYTIAPVIEAFLRNLSALRPSQQEDVLFSASEKCLAVDLDSEKAPPYNSNDALSVNKEQHKEELLLVNERHKDPDARVVSGQEMVSYLDRRKGLRLAGNNSVPLDLVGMFDTEGAAESRADSLPTCTVVLWKMPPKEKFLSFPLDEMAFFLLRGQVKWHYSGAKPVTLGTGRDDSRRLWMRAATTTIPTKGLPPFYVETLSNEPAIGLAVFYNKSGVQLSSVRGAQVELKATPWSANEVDEYWNQAQASYGDLARQLPTVDCVPTTTEALERYVRENGPAGGIRSDVHDQARQAGQISDADLYTWDDEQAVVLQARIVKFSGADVPPQEDEVWMGHHDGREIIIPLKGMFKYLMVERRPSEVEELPFRQCSTFPTARRKRGLVLSAEYSNIPFSDVLLLNSSNWHGFSGVMREDAYCLHFRCRAPRQGGSRNHDTTEKSIEEPKRDQSNNSRSVAGSSYSLISSSATNSKKTQLATFGALGDLSTVSHECDSSHEEDSHAFA